MLQWVLIWIRISKIQEYKFSIEAQAKHCSVKTNKILKITMENFIKVVLVCVGILILGFIADIGFAIIIGLLAVALPYILLGLGIAFALFVICSIIK